MLISLAVAKEQIRMDQDYSDPDIERLIRQASGAVLTYLKGAPIGEPDRDQNGAIVRDSNGDIVYQRDSSGTLIIRWEIQGAVRLLLGEYFKNREAEQDGQVADQWGYGYLPRPVIALLYPLRDPALA